MKKFICLIKKKNKWSIKPDLYDRPDDCRFESDNIDKFKFISVEL